MVGAQEYDKKVTKGADEAHSADATPDFPAKISPAALATGADAAYW